MHKTTNSIKDLIHIPWLGVRRDLILHPGPLDHDGQQTWVLEDPVRGSNYRLGYVEGEMLLRLMLLPNPDAALQALYATTGLRPGMQEAALFLTMLQKEALAILPAEEIVQQSLKLESMTPVFFQKIMAGAIFFRVPLFKPDALLTRTYAWVKLLWSPWMRMLYLLCGFLGIIFTFQELELYLGSVSYLFTPQGALIFIICLVVLKIGHEFAHAYTAKSYGLHVRSMGIFFIVFWPLLYTDTTAAWKIPDRRKRMHISLAGVLFEAVVGSMALLAWYLLPDGILRSLSFFLSGTSLVSSILVNLNPFMRYDGYYVLMDLWGLDNLKQRSQALFRHAVRCLLLGWNAPAPEIHPHSRGMIIYGMLAGLYRLLVGFSIALAVYFLYIPLLGLILGSMTLWLFLIAPLVKEIRAIIRKRNLIGSHQRLLATIASITIILILICVPFPRMHRAPCLLLHKNSARLLAPGSGQLVTNLKPIGTLVKAHQLITRIHDPELEYQAQKIDYDLKSVRASINAAGSGGSQGAYRTWLQAEEKRLLAGAEKIEQAMHLLEIRAPFAGRIVAINQKVYQGAGVDGKTYLCTLSRSDQYEVRAFVREGHRGYDSEKESVRVRFAGPEFPVLDLVFQKRSAFAVQRLPNDSLLDIAGGPIVSKPDGRVRTPRDAFFTYTYDVMGKIPAWLPEGTPARICLWSKPRSLAADILVSFWKPLLVRGIY